MFVLIGFANRSTDFIIIAPNELLKRLDSIHGKSLKKFQTYLWITQHGKCYDRSDQLSIAERKFENDARDFTAYLNNWTPIRALND